MGNFRPVQQLLIGFQVLGSRLKTWDHKIQIQAGKWTPHGIFIRTEKAVAI
jgi:hypothetical protein